MLQAEGKTADFMALGDSMIKEGFAQDYALARKRLMPFLPPVTARP